MPSSRDREKSELLLLSGGIDSAALAFDLMPEFSLTIDYGQESARGEIRAARQVASAIGIPHDIVEVDCKDLGTGQLAGEEQVDCAPVPEWWPFRNQLLVTIAGMYGLPIGVNRILLGIVKGDSEHVDGRESFVSAMDRLMGMQEGDMCIAAPALEMSSEELVRHADIPLELLVSAHSCHTSATPCGECRGCMKRDRVLAEVFERYP